MKLTKEQMELTEKMLDDVFAIFHKYIQDLGVEEIMREGTEKDFANLRDVLHTEINGIELGILVKILANRLIRSKQAREVIKNQVQIPISARLLVEFKK